MAIVTTDNQHYAAIASAIRDKNGESTQYQPSQMAAAIAALATGGGEQVTLKSGTMAVGETVVETGLRSVEWFVLYSKTRASGSPRMKISIMDPTGSTTVHYYNYNAEGSTLCDRTDIFSTSGGTVTWLKYNGWTIVENMTWFAVGQG